MLKEILEQKKCFKLICGAGNEDVDSVEKLVAVYAAAGCKFFDISADNKVIAAAKRGFERVKQEQKKYLCISIGTKNDVHFKKAKIDKSICLNCYKCVSNCPQKAIDTNLIVNQEKCIGCGRCEISCPTKSIFYEEKKMHLRRKKFSDEKMIGILEKLLRDRKPYSTIIQADGSPMSGGVDDFESTLQAVSVGNLIQKADLKQYLIVSGGTNSKTMELSKICSVDINGVAIGSFARKIVAKYIDRQDFWYNQEVFDKAVCEAKNLISKLFG